MALTTNAVFYKGLRLIYRNMVKKIKKAYKNLWRKGNEKGNVIHCFAIVSLPLSPVIIKAAVSFAHNFFCPVFLDTD